MELGLLDEEHTPDEKRDAEKKDYLYGLVLSCDDRKRMVTAGATIRYSIKVTNRGLRDDKISIKTTLITENKDLESEWVTKLTDFSFEDEIDEKKSAGKDEFELSSDKSITFTIEVVVPQAIKYGERAEVIVTATSLHDPAISDSITLSMIARQQIFAVKTIIGHEKTVADYIATKSKEDSDIFSIISPPMLRGYILVEAMSSDKVRSIIRGIPKAHGLVDGDTSFSEIEHLLVPKPLVSRISEGDIVELIAGPFKGERAIIRQIDESKEEITLELFEAMVPIPITVRGDHVRIIEKEGKSHG
jgi:transcriptional antiterminator NusG